MSDILEDLKKMVDYKESDLDYDGESFLNLVKKVGRNESFMKYVLYIAHKTLVKDEGFTIKDLVLNTKEDEGNLRKINEQFVNHDLIFKHKKGIRCFFRLNKNEDSLKAFKELLIEAKKQNE